jgi:hypothetical protein
VREGEPLSFGIADPTVPLVYDQACAIHGGRLSIPENAFCSVYPVVSRRAPNDLDDLLWTGDVIKDMDMVIKFQGSTVLEVWQVFNGDTERDVRDTRYGVAITTQFVVPYTHPRDWPLITNEYELSAGNGYDRAVYSIIYPLHRVWQYDLDDLIHGLSIRAQRHARLHLTKFADADRAEHLAKQLARFYLPQRTINYEPVFDKLVNYVDEVSEDDICLICQAPFDEDSEPVQLPCRHVFDRECMLKWVEEKGPQRAGCPLRCGPLFAREQDQIRLLYDVKLEDDVGYLHFDKRYEDWEHIQRSFATLDKYHASEDTVHTMPMPSPEMFLDIWDTIQKLDDQYPDARSESRMPESIILLFGLDEGLRDLPRGPQTAAWLFKRLRAAIHRAFLNEYCISGRGNNIPQQLILEAYNNPSSLSVDSICPGDVPDLDVDLYNQTPLTVSLYRPGYAEHISRMLNRTIQCLRLRACNCKNIDDPEQFFSHMTWEQAFEHTKHLHGFSFFYNPKVYDYLFSNYGRRLSVPLKDYWEQEGRFKDGQPAERGGFLVEEVGMYANKPYTFM